MLPVARADRGGVQERWLQMVGWLVHEFNPEKVHLISCAVFLFHCAVRVSNSTAYFCRYLLFRRILVLYLAIYSQKEAGQ
jgi:hypothetical protein